MGSYYSFAPNLQRFSFLWVKARVVLRLPLHLWPLLLLLSPKSLLQLHRLLQFLEQARHSSHSGPWIHFAEIFPWYTSQPPSSLCFTSVKSNLATKFIIVNLSPLSALLVPRTLLYFPSTFVTFFYTDNRLFMFVVPLRQEYKSHCNNYVSICWMNKAQRG